jgi:hypothetical protein
MSAPRARFKMGDKLILEAPAHTGLPMGASCMVASLLAWDGDSHKYSVTLMGGGRHGSDVRFIKSVSEGWLRGETRIATARSCAPLVFADFVQLAPRLLVPIFQRRYLWDDADWKRLWHDIVFPRGLGAHAIGRVVIARQRRAVLLVDGQQRCTTMMLLLAALRDLATEMVAPDAAAPLASAVDAVLLSTTPGGFSRRSRLVHAVAGDSATPASARPAPTPSDVSGLALGQASIGLEGVEGADRVRLIPSREDRLPFCSAMLGTKFDRERSAAARKIGACRARARPLHPPHARARIAGGAPCSCAATGIMALPSDACDWGAERVSGS